MSNEMDKTLVKKTEDELAMDKAFAALVTSSNETFYGLQINPSIADAFAKEHGVGLQHVFHVLEDEIYLRERTNQLREAREFVFQDPPLREALENPEFAKYC